MRFIIFILFFLLVIDAAYARKMSQFEWMDPESAAIWKSLTAGEKKESVQDWYRYETGEEKSGLVAIANDPGVTALAGIAKAFGGGAEKIFEAPTTEKSDPESKEDNKRFEESERLAKENNKKMMEYAVPKIVKCMDKEIADPDYQGSKPIMYAIIGYCKVKYDTIFDQKFGTQQ